MKIKQQNKRRCETRREVIRGTAQQVIIVPSPVPGVFREAVFFLQEDYLRCTDQSREALLKQARASAEEYLRPYVPATRKREWWPYPLFTLLGMTIGLTIGIFLGA